MNRGNGKIDMVGLIDGLYSVCVCVILNCHMRSKQRVEKHVVRRAHTLFLSTLLHIIISEMVIGEYIHTHTITICIVKLATCNSKCFHTCFEVSHSFTYLYVGVVPYNLISISLNYIGIVLLRCSSKTTTVGQDTQ